MIVKKFQEVPKKKSFVCGCGKEYRYNSGFYRHKRSCTYTEDDIIEESIESIKKRHTEKVEFCKEIFPYLKDIMLEIMPKMQSTTINTTSYNNHLMEENMELKKMIMGNYGQNVTNNINNNQNLNINIFLNEQCKDAMNLTEFLESIQLNLKDLMKIADDGQTI